MWKITLDAGIMGILLALGTILTGDVAGSETQFNQIRREHRVNADKLFENALKKKDLIPLHGAFARLWLNRELPKANQLLHEAQQAIIKNEKGKGVMTAEIASSEHVKWQMRTWNRIYHLFNDKSRFHPGRLDKTAQAMIEETFWLYVGKMSSIERAGLEHVWGISGSENHEMMHYSNALLALQALKNSPAYRDKKLPDGRTAEQHYKAFNAYYKHYCDERAKHGLLIELFAQYGPSYTLPEITNMRDLSEDDVLRERMDKLLHLIWADWAVGQVIGVRGGGRTRLYQGENTADGQYDWGEKDRWRTMSQYFLGTGNLWAKERVPNHPIHGAWFVYATTGYRLPDVIMDIALDVKGRGEYVYVARRIAKQRRLSAKQIPIKRKNAPWYAFDPNDPGMVEYDYCTPDYVMGSLMIDPRLNRVGSNTQPPKDLAAGYPALTAQNRYHSIVFASDINARVVPQCEGLGNHKTYNQQQAVQHRNVMLVQRIDEPKSNQTGDMRVIFGGRGMKKRLVEHDGWLILKEGDAWLGVKGFSRKTANESCGYTWDDDVHLRMKDGDAPVAFVAGQRSEYATQKDFTDYLDTFAGALKNGWFSLDHADAKSSLSLQLESKDLPKVDGKPVDLQPKMLFDSPFVHSVHGSGIVTIQKGTHTLEIDMN